MSPRPLVHIDYQNGSEIKMSPRHLVHIDYQNGSEIKMSRPLVHIDYQNGSEILYYNGVIQRYASFRDRQT